MINPKTIEKIKIQNYKIEKLIVNFRILINLCNDALKTLSIHTLRRYVHKSFLTRVFEYTNINYRIIYDIFSSILFYNNLRILPNSNNVAYNQFCCKTVDNQNTCQIKILNNLFIFKKYVYSFNLK